MTSHQLLIKNSLLTVFAVVAIVIAFFGVIDQKGETYTDNAFNRALITFGVARSINGVISVAQGTEIAVHPAGFGVNFTPGQILDPINDIIEQFSWVMLASTASLGIQKIFLSMSSSWICSAMLAVLLLLVTSFVWKPGLLSQPNTNLIKKMLLVMIFVRFSIPVAAIGSELLYKMFLSQQYSESTQMLEQTKDTISSLSNEQQTELPEDNNTGVLDKAKKWFSSATDTIDIEARLEEYKQAATEATRHTINLIVVFVIQTVVFPLLFLWIVYRFLREIGGKMI